MNKSNNTIKRNIVVPIIASVLCMTIIMTMVNALRFDIANVLVTGMIALCLGLLLIDSLEGKKVKKEKEENITENEIETCNEKKAIEEIGLLFKSLLVRSVRFLMVISIIIFGLLLVIVDSFNGDITVSIDTTKKENSVMYEVDNNDSEPGDITTNLKEEINK